MEVIKAIIIIYKMYVVYSFEREKPGPLWARENKTNNQKSKPNTTKQGHGGRTHKDEKTKHGGKLFHNSDIPRSEKVPPGRHLFCSVAASFLY